MRPWMRLALCESRWAVPSSSHEPDRSQPPLSAPRARLPRAHPIAAALRLAISGLFAVVPRLFVDMQIHGLEYDTRAPSTYFAIAHKRDLDSIAPLPVLLTHGGWPRLVRDLHFAMRADGFEPGFLSRTVRSPAWLSRALHWLAVRPILRLVGDHPLCRIPGATGGELAARCAEG